MNNTEALLEICLRLARSKNKFYAEVAGRCTGLILREIGQNLSGILATSLQVDEVSQSQGVKIFKNLEEISLALKNYKRGIVELNEIEYFIEKISPRVASIKLNVSEESYFSLKNK